MMGKKLDIVDRLKDMAGKSYNHTWSAWVQTQCDEGAKEIELLRTEVANLTLKSSAMQLVIAALATKAGFSEDVVVEALELAEKELKPIVLDFLTAPQPLQ